LENGVSNLITSKGFGESDPKYDNTDTKIKAKNRRVEIYFNN
jgi:flagellar motor protein MotB